MIWQLGLMSKSMQTMDIFYKHSTYNSKHLYIIMQQLCLNN